MIRSFDNSESEDIYNGKATKSTRRTLPNRLLRVALRKLEQLDSVERLSDLSIPPGNRLEVLKGERTGQHSIRINNQYSICFKWTELGPEQVGIVDYHS